jgi:GNAT superfamily N-acetyltransferase
MIRRASVLDAEAIARVHLAAWAETYAGIVPSEFLARWSLRDRTARWERILSGDPPDPHRADVGVLVTDGALGGFASWGEQRDDALRERGYSGEISAIYLLARIQGQGHGRAMMAHAAQGLLQRGHGTASLWVTRDNKRARGFYEGLGGTLCGEQKDDLAGFPITTVAYGWTSLDHLAAKGPGLSCRLEPGRQACSTVASAACPNIGVGSSQ